MCTTAVTLTSLYSSSASSKALNCITMSKQFIRDDSYQISEEEKRVKRAKVNGAPFQNSDAARADAIMTTASPLLLAAAVRWQYT